MNFGFIKQWETSLRSSRFRIMFIVTIIALVGVIYSLTKFLNYNELRPAVGFTDPILELLPHIDLTWFTFILIYVGLITGLISLAKYPTNLLTGIHAYILMILFRIIAMYSLPLAPPAGMIILQDPIVEIFGGGPIYVKDLFFSGHTSTMFLLYLTAKSKWFRVIFLIFTILIGAFVLLQHVHYSVDVIAAPFFAYGAYRLAMRIQSQN